MNDLKLLEDLLRRTSPTPAVLKKVEESVRKAISATVLFLSLDEAQRFGLDGVKALARQIGLMSQADLKKLLKKWDQHRKVSNDVTTTELREIASSLLNAEFLPMPKPPPAPRSRAKKKVT